MANDKQCTACSSDAHVDTALICHEPDRAVMHTSCTHTTENDDIFLTALEATQSAIIWQCNMSSYSVGIGMSIADRLCSQISMIGEFDPADCIHILTRNVQSYY